MFCLLNLFRLTKSFFYFRLLDMLEDCKEGVEKCLKFLDYEINVPLPGPEKND